MTTYFQDAHVTLYHGDCRDVLPELSSIETCITDPPYGIRFMEMGWDRGVPGMEFWELVRGALLPGASLLAFGGTRTFHRLTCAIEDADFAIRDCLMWLYGSGFPKSLDLSKAIDKAAGHWRGRAGKPTSGNDAMSGPNYERTDKGIPVTTTAAAASGWGTALKPAWEPIVLAMKPTSGTFARNAMRHGVAGLNIDGARIGIEERVNQPMRASHNSYGGYAGTATATATVTVGRWPSNLLLDGGIEQVWCLRGNTDGRTRVVIQEFFRDYPAVSPVRDRDRDVPQPSGPKEVLRTPMLRGLALSEQERGASSDVWEALLVLEGDLPAAWVKYFRPTGLSAQPSGGAARLLDEQSGELAPGGWPANRQGIGYTQGPNSGTHGEARASEPGGASRFFYTSKAGASERETERGRNTHPTVKPLDLMAYLCRLTATPTGGIVLDPFAGSGSTLIAALRSGRKAIGIELEEAYCEIAVKRIQQENLDLFGAA